MTKHLVLLLAAGLTALPIVTAAEKPKTSTVAEYPFWNSKKRGPVPQFVPGLTAALQLTDAQREKIATARDEMSNDEGVKAARSISKSDPNVTAEQREKARATMEAAVARQHAKV